MRGISRFQPSILSLREAIGKPFQKGGIFIKPDWQLYVRPKGQPEVVPLSNLLDVEFDDWEVRSERFGRVFSLAFSNGVDERDEVVVSWDQYAITEGPALGPNKPGQPDTRACGAIVVPYIRDSAGRYLVAVIKRVRQQVVNPKTGRLEQTVLIELPRGYAKATEGEVQTAVREYIEEIDQSPKVRLSVASIADWASKREHCFLLWICQHFCSRNNTEDRRSY
jgi:hypothetical protein